jgi:50S ribosome-binding GTPase
MNAALLNAILPVRQALLSIAHRSMLPGAAVDRALVDLGAAEFHLVPRHGPPIVALVGGTGTGKSTLSNRLLDATATELTASHYRRTFTAGPVAIAAAPDALPEGWLHLPREAAATLPARGLEGKLVTVVHESSLTKRIVLVDTPDVDGDQPLHHALADRVFRWAQAIVFVVSPEKYQMTELLPYYRLGQRYAVPAFFVMNKVDDRAVVDDFARQLVAGGIPSPRVFAVARDDSTFAPSDAERLDALRGALSNLDISQTPESTAGARRRVVDVTSRVNDQVLEPLRTRRKQVDIAIDTLRQMRTREAGVDVDPMTRALRKRMQQRSVLYLMGPQRMLERLKGAPAMLARLPRSTIDLFRGKSSSADAPAAASKVELPDFASIVADQFVVAQEQMGDVVRRAASPSESPTDVEASAADAWRLDRSLASEIVTSETEALRQWLEARWNANPRDTALILKLVQKLPGGQRLTRLSESAPYLVVLACGLNHLAFSGLDLVVIGGFSLVAWLGEKMSDEVAQRTRQTNRNIDRRFAELIRRQSDAAIDWLNASIPDRAALDALARHLDDLRGLAEDAAKA